MDSTVLNEAGFPPYVIDAVLAHVDTNQTRAACNRSTYLVQRVAVMDWWGEKISESAPRAVF